MSNISTSGADQEAQPGTSVTTAVLLAAGRGKRLRPHTDSVPKPLLPYQGRPTLAHVLDALVVAGIQHVVVVTHHLHEQIDAFIAEQLGVSSDLSIQSVRQHELLGTADALESAMTAYPALFVGDFLLSATDYLIDQGFYQALLMRHRVAQRATAGQATLTVSLKPVPPNELGNRSSVRFDASGERVLEIVEKPAPGMAPSAIGANLAFVLPAGMHSYVAAVQAGVRGEREIQSAINAWLQDHAGGWGLLQGVPAEWQAPD